VVLGQGFLALGLSGSLDLLLQVALAAFVLPPGGDYDVVKSFRRACRARIRRTVNKLAQGPEETLNPNPQPRRMKSVPLTLEQIVEEARHWPPEKVGELVDRLSEALHPADPAIDQAWKEETRRRLAEIENGTVQAVDGEQVSARIGRIVGM